MEEELVLLEFGLSREVSTRGLRGRESGRKLKDGLGRSRKSVTLLSEEDIIVDPVLGQGETLSQSSVLVSLGEQPWGVHKVVCSEELGNFLPINILFLYAMGRLPCSRERYLPLRHR